MNQALKIYELGERFYVPQFELKIGGRELEERVIHDVLEVKYTDNVDEIDAFEIRLNNWDTSHQKPKYEPPAPGIPEGLFDPGGLSDPDKKLELYMGYVGDLHLMLTGEVTTLEPEFPASGGLTLSVRGLNELHRFRSVQHTFSWTEKKDSDIASDLGAAPVDDDRPGLGIEVRTDPDVLELPEPYIFMDNQYDIVFLMNRARRHDYELVLREDDDGKHLFFGPSKSKSERPAPYLLEWGKSLISFRPTLSTVNQVSEVVVRGWDRRTNRKIEAKKSWKDLVPAGPERDRLQVLANAFGSRREIVTDYPVHTLSQAKDRAKSILEKHLKMMVTASGATVGLPNLRAGRRVQIVNLGPRYDGEYFVTKTTHTIGDGGYRTDFEARREGAAETATASGGSQ